MFSSCKMEDATANNASSGFQIPRYDQLRQTYDMKWLEEKEKFNNQLKENDYGFYIKYDGKSSDLVTLSSISTELAEFKPPSVLRGLSTPALETLSIVAYEQPVTKLKVSEIRGVESESSLKTLESRGLIEKSGYLDVPGNPHLYITTNLFLEKLDIASIDDLPVLGEYFSNVEEE